MEGARQEGVQVYPQSLYKHFITLCIMYVFGHKGPLVHCVESVLLCGSWGGAELRFFGPGSKCLNLQNYPANSTSPLLVGFCLFVFSKVS